MSFESLGFRPDFVPEHVPEHLVRPYPFAVPPGTLTKQKPHSLIAAVHEGPELFWAKGGYVGLIGAWVPRRAEDITKVDGPVQSNSW